jgi:pyruvate dehydrogenase E2 component (dihydrolipoamide acetyltransferase)
MAIVSIQIPQLGEGLQEARVVAFLKQPGDVIKRDEPIYQMETDKAVMDVESPYSGTLVEWLAAEDDLLPIGNDIARIETQDAVQEVSSHGAPVAEDEQAETNSGSGVRGANIPPRTRAYAKEKGLTDEQLSQLAESAGSKLMPADIDAFLSGGASDANASFAETPLPTKQRVLNNRMLRATQLVVPGTEVVVVNWGPIEELRAEAKSGGSDFQPSAFTMFSFAVAKALAKFPAFRTTLVNEQTLRTYHHANLGIAVSLPGDELVLAVVNEADTLDWQTFAMSMRERIEFARAGNDQANETVTLSLTNMQSFGLRDAVPVVVPPSVGTLFLGEVYNGLAQDTSELRLQRCANVTLTFDHRVINGVGAAQFLAAVKANVEGIRELLR